jgi:outer membrane protein
MESRVEQTRGPLLPQLNANAQASRTHGAFARVGTGTTGSSSAGTSDLFSFGLVATQTLWDFGAIERFRAAGFTFEAQQATARATELQVVLAVRRAYFAASAQAALLKVAERTLENQQVHLKQIEGFVKAAQRTGIDLAQAQTAVASAQLQVINARNGFRLACASLSQTVGAQEPHAAQLEDAELPALENELADVGTLVKQALEHRPELKALRQQQEAQVATVLGVRGGWAPTLGATGSVSEAGVALDNLGINWSLGVSLTWNLFNGLQTTGLLSEAQYQAQLLQGQLDAELLQVRVDVEQARATIEDQLSAVQAATTAVTAAKAQLALAEGRYAAGVGSVLELGDAQVQVTTMESQLVQARLTLFTARAQLSAALGELP